MRKLKIAQVTNLEDSIPSIQQHGLEQVVYFLTEELLKMGHDVTVFGTADSKVSAKLEKLWPVAASRDPYGHYLDHEFFTVLALSTVFRRHEEFDIIHDHSRFFSPYFAELISTPIVTTVHNSMAHIKEQGYKTVFPSEYQEYFKTWEEKREKVHTVMVSEFQTKKYTGESQFVHNGIFVDSIPFELSRGDYLAFIAYITPDKGAAEAVQVAIKANKKLLIARPLDDSELNQKYFHERIEPYLDNKKIKYVGPLNYDQKMEFLRKAEASLMPIQWDEPFGMVAIESLACGTPVIALNRAALPEIIEEGKSGFLASSIDEMALKVSLLGQIDRQNCRQRVVDKFTSRKMAEGYVSIYNQILNIN